MLKPKGLQGDRMWPVPCLRFPQSSFALIPSLFQEVIVRACFKGKERKHRLPSSLGSALFFWEETCPTAAGLSHLHPQVCIRLPHPLGMSSMAGFGTAASNCSNGQEQGQFCPGDTGLCFHVNQPVKCNNKASQA